MLICYWGFDAVELLVAEVAVRWIAMHKSTLRLDMIVSSEYEDRIRSTPGLYASYLITQIIARFWAVGS